MMSKIILLIFSNEAHLDHDGSKVMGKIIGKIIGKMMGNHLHNHPLCHNILHIQRQITLTYLSHCATALAATPSLANSLALNLLVVGSRSSSYRLHTVLAISLNPVVSKTDELQQLYQSWLVLISL
jgi:hypothetical protein